MKILKQLIVAASLVSSPVAAFAAGDAPAMIDKATYSLVATFRVKEGQVDRFIKAMKMNTIESRKEAGVVDYRSYQSPKDPKVFINFEAYTDKAAFDAHLASPHVKEVGPIFDEILSGPIEANFLNNY